MFSSQHMRTDSTRTAALPSHILLLDDNKMGLCARKSVLEELGYRITAFTGVQEALDAFESTPFDLVITDYRMPKMNGVQVIERMREHKPGTLAILISGVADTLGLSEASTGADIVIQKSNHEITNLVRSVQRLLSRKVTRKPAGAQAAALKAKRKTTSS